MRALEAGVDETGAIGALSFDKMHKDMNSINALASPTKETEKEEEDEREPQPTDRHKRLAKANAEVEGANNDMLQNIDEVRNSNAVG
jgi:hypothetical protein